MLNPLIGSDVELRCGWRLPRAQRHDRARATAILYCATADPPPPNDGGGDSIGD
jgi:hypothetical protein